MDLRKLKQKDAPLMLEWMHDDSVVHDMGTDFSRKTLDDCHAFISSSETDFPCVHRAIVNENDEYMGTVSLKNIDQENRNAEFAITVRKGAMGKGYSAYGMREMIRIGFEQYGLDFIYWYVSKNNARAIRFYEKNGYKQVDVNKIPNRGGGTASRQISMVCYAAINATSRLKEEKLNMDYRLLLSAGDRKMA